MVFSSLTFLFYFLPIVLIIYYIVPNKVKNLVLFISSLIFYFIGEPKYVILMIVSILSTYIHGILIEKYEKHKKKFLISSIVISLSFLVFFKYTDFIIENVNAIFNGSFDLLNLALPIGISFYTFQSMGYIIDMYQGKYKADRNIFKFALFVSYFPQILQGPIGRYNRLAHQFFERHSFELVRIQHGLQLMAWGFFKKMVLADRAAVVVTEVFRYVDLYDGATVLF